MLARTANGGVFQWGCAICGQLGLQCAHCPQPRLVPALDPSDSIIQASRAVPCTQPLVIGALG